MSEDIEDDDVTLDRAWLWLNDPSQHATPQTTINALMLCVRERGLNALDEPANVERLARCDADARTEIKNRIVKFGLVEHA